MKNEELLFVLSFFNLFFAFLSLFNFYYYLCSVDELTN